MAAQSAICIAKTQYSFSTDPQLRGAPEGHVFNVRDVYLNARAGFMVVLSGEFMTMPGLPKIPASDHIDIDANGNIIGLAQSVVVLTATRRVPKGARRVFCLAAPFEESLSG